MNKSSDNFSCPACRSGQFNKLDYKITDYEYRVPYTPVLVRCSNCGLVRHEDIPGYERLEDFYPDDYLVYNMSFKDASNALYSKLKNILYSMRAKKVAKLVGPSGNILDVGCANGAFLLSIKQFGNYGLYGLDIKDTGMNFEKQGINFKEGFLEELEYPDDFFDAIVLDNVLEHVPDPVLFMRKVVSILKPGGHVFGTTPNFNSLDRIVFQQYWGGFHMPRHLYLFNAQNLKMFMMNMGLSEMELPVSANAADWAVSVQNFMRRNTKNEGKYKRAQYFPIVAMMLAPVAFISSIFNLNGVMDFICTTRSR